MGESKGAAAMVAEVPRHPTSQVLDNLPEIGCYARKSTAGRAAVYYRA